MKKIFSYILLTFFVFSCSTTDNPTVEVVPLSPIELTGNLTDIGQVTLNWKDNSTNETGFRIDRQIKGGNYSEIGTVGSDITSYVDNGLLASTTYYYRIVAYNKAGNSVTSSNEVAITTPASITIPIVQIYDVSASATIASGGGNVTSDGGSAVMGRGLVWSTLPNPTIELTTKTSNGTGIGGFKSDLSSLKPNTIYYVRAYATNNVGTSYSNEISFKTLQNSTSEIKWKINGTNYQNGIIQKTISSSKFEVLDNENGLFLYIFPDNGKIENNTIYNPKNANVDIAINYDFKEKPKYDKIALLTKSIKILEFNSNYISGEFSASEAVLFNSKIGYTYGNPATGNYEPIEYNITNGTFIIFR